MSEPLTDSEKITLLRLARESLENAVRGKHLPVLEETQLTPTLREAGASFVTLTIRGELRGCIGTLQAYQPLADDVREHAVSAGLDDYRFPPVNVGELSRIHIEVSRLTAPQILVYTNADDLLTRLRPGVDGVILMDGSRRATFLPQVWENLPESAGFLNQLCAKMGAAPNLWRHKHLDVKIYQVEEFQEHK
jgi:AmmeMemoRadiSam system protein A